MKLPIIPQDKANHFIYGLAIFVVGCLAAMQFAKLAPWAGHIGTGLCVLLGAGKEFYDRRNPERHTSDTADFFGTALGGVAGWALTLL